MSNLDILAGGTNIVRDSSAAHKELRFGTFNVGTVNDKKKWLRESLDRNKVDIACLQETRLIRQEEAIDDSTPTICGNYLLYYEGTEIPRNGVAVMIHERYKENIVSSHYVSDRIMYLIVFLYGKYICVLSCYAPQFQRDDYEKDQFWKTLNDLLVPLNAFDLLLIGGDFNGHVGAKCSDYSSCHGGSGYGKRNAEGIRILNFAAAHNLALTNTFTPIKERNELITFYTGENSGTQIDYCLTQAHFIKMVTNTKVIRGSTYNTSGLGHCLLISDINFQLWTECRDTRVASGQTSWWRITEFKGDISRYARRSLKDVENWERLTKKLKEWSTHTIGLNRTNIQMGMNTGIGSAANTRNDKFEIFYKCLESIFKATLKNKEHRTFAIASKMREVARDLGIPWPHVSQQGTKIRNRGGTLLSDCRESLNYWKTYFSEIFSAKQDDVTQEAETKSPDDQELRISADDIKVAIDQSDTTEETGYDEIPIDFWKILGETRPDILVEHFNKIITRGFAPNTWKTIIVIAAWKGVGDAFECENYQTQFLQCHARIIFENILAAKLNEQLGGLSCHKETWESNPLAHVALLDLKESFYNIPHDRLLQVLRSQKIPEAYIKCVQLLYHQCVGIFRCSSGDSPSFKMTKGIFSHSMMDVLLKTVKSCIPGPSTFSLLRAGKVFLIGKDEPTREEEIKKWKTTLHQNLGVAIEKPLKSRCFTRTIKSIFHETEFLEQVEYFTAFEFVVIIHNNSA